MGNSGTTAKAAADEDQTRSKSVDRRPGRKRSCRRLEVRHVEAFFSKGNRVSWAGSLSPICNEKIDWFIAFIHESTCLSLVGLYFLFQIEER